MTSPKELLEVLELVRAAGVEMQEIFADGKVGLTDLQDVAQLWAPAKAAVMDANKIPAEVQAVLATGDLQAIEELVSKLVAIADAWVKAFAAISKVA